MSHSNLKIKRKIFYPKYWLAFKVTFLHLLSLPSDPSIRGCFLCIHLAFHIREAKCTFSFPLAVTMPRSITFIASLKPSQLLRLLSYPCHPPSIISSVLPCILWGYWNLVYSFSLTEVSNHHLRQQCYHTEKSFKLLIPWPPLIQCLVSKQQTLDSPVYLFSPLWGCWLGTGEDGWRQGFDLG